MDSAVTLTPPSRRHYPSCAKRVEILPCDSDVPAELQVRQLPQVEPLAPNGRGFATFAGEVLDRQELAFYVTVLQLDLLHDLVLTEDIRELQWENGLCCQQNSAIRSHGLRFTTPEPPRKS